MKNKIKKAIHIAISVAAVALFSTCSDNAGDETSSKLLRPLQFTASIGTPDSRTVSLSETGNTYSLKWADEGLENFPNIAGIYCPQAAEDYQYARYDITIDETDSSKALLTLRKNETPLKWNTNNLQHTFYAVAGSSCHNINDEELYNTINVSEIPTVSYERFSAYDDNGNPTGKYDTYFGFNVPSSYPYKESFSTVLWGKTDPVTIGKSSIKGDETTYVPIKFQSVLTILDITVKNSSGNTLFLYDKFEAEVLNEDGSNRYIAGYFNVDDIEKCEVALSTDTDDSNNTIIFDAKGDCVSDTEKLKKVSLTSDYYEANSIANGEVSKHYYIPIMLTKAVTTKDKLVVYVPTYIYNDLGDDKTKINGFKVSFSPSFELKAAPYGQIVKIELDYKAASYTSVEAAFQAKINGISVITQTNSTITNKDIYTGEIPGDVTEGS